MKWLAARDLFFQVCNLEKIIDDFKSSNKCVELQTNSVRNIIQRLKVVDNVDLYKFDECLILKNECRKATSTHSRKRDRIFKR